MTVLQPPARQTRLQGIWLSMGIVGPLGMLLVSGLMLFHIRQDTWKTVDQTSDNLLQVIEQAVERNISLYDLSLQGLIEGLASPDLGSASPNLRQLVLFDRAANASDKGVMLVLDENGNITDDMGKIPPRKANYADRDYFQIQRDRADAGLFISKPLVSRLTGVPIIALSRRISKPDGSFGGVVVGTLKLSYFTRLFAQVGLGQNGAINLFRDDGTRIARYPYVDADIGTTIAGSTTFERFVREKKGSFTATSARDHVRRHYAFSGIAGLPLILDVAVSVDDIESGWRTEAFIIGLTSLLLCGSTIGLVLWAAREFRRRIASEAELARLSATDGLTGVPNRRRFDAALPSACSDTRREDKPLSLLIVDADHFKRINDQFGHQVGDEVLKSIARCLTAVVHRETDLVCRLGGEEFALLLPHTDLRGAQQVAEEVHRRITGFKSWPAGIKAGMVTVSIGLACSRGWDGVAPEDLYGAADGALYKAKAGGRNRTCCATSVPTGKQDTGTLLRIAG